MRTNRKSAPGVRDGKVQKKNRTASSPDYYVQDADEIAFHRLRPVEGYYHAVSITDVKRFIGIIPDWVEVSVGIKAIVLTPGDDYCYGRYHNAGVIKLDAWPRNGINFVSGRKRWLLEAMNAGIPEDRFTVHRFSQEQARCFLLMGTFLHELGHHIDRMTNRTKLDAANGEPFAIRYEQQRQRELWPAYLREFGDPQ